MTKPTKHLGYTAVQSNEYLHLVLNGYSQGHESSAPIYIAND